MRRITSRIVPFGLVLLAAAGLRADEAEIRTFLRSYVDAFNRQDLDAVAAMWTEHSTHVDRDSGERTEGRSAIRADLEDVFKRTAKTRLAGEVSRVRFLTADVARVEGKTSTSVAGDEPGASRFSAILVKRDDNWQFDSIEETSSQPATAREALRQLDWLKGDWVDDSKDAPVVSSFRWSPSGTFLIRSIAAKAGQKTTPVGTQVIGFDPRSKSIRSWTFNADGSFGESVWTKTGRDWSIHSTQTLVDGRLAVGTYVISPVDANTIRLRLVGHEVNGEPQPSPEPSVLVRVSASGATARTAATSDN